MMVDAMRAARRRVGADDSGFTLIYTLLVVTVVTVLVGSVLVVTSNAVVPSVQSAYSEAADAAAQGGLQAFVAYADANCQNANSSVRTCALPQTSSGTTSISDDTNYRATYRWSAQQDTVNYAYFRVTSVGTVTQGGVSATRTLVADVGGGASTDDRDYAVVTGYETQAPDVVQQAYPNRTVALDATAAANADLVPGRGATSVTWSGATNGSGVAGCNQLFYAKDGSAGRAQSGPPGASTPYVDWRETGTVGAGAAVTDYQPCQVSLGASTKLQTAGADGLGGYASRDALLISNSYPGGTGPLLNERVITGYQYDAATGTACERAGRDYRTFDLTCAGYPVNVGGTPRGTFTPTYNSSVPVVPSSAPVIATGACVYTGPTRVLLNANGTATITSPLTTAAVTGSPAGCYPATVSAGIFGFTTATTLAALPGFNGTMSVRNAGSQPGTPACTDSASGRTMSTSTGWNVTCQHVGDAATATDSIFYRSAGAAGTTTANAETETATDAGYTPATGDNPSTKTDAAWTPRWTSFSTGSTCTTSTSTADLKFFNCYQSGGTYSASAYSTLKTTVKNAVSSAPASYDTAATLQAYLTSVLARGNSSDAGAANPSTYTNASHRWLVSVAPDASTTDGCTPATNVSGTATTTPIAAPSGDPLFTNRAGTSVATPTTNTTCFTATVTLQVGTCNVALIAGICLNIGNYVWGNGAALTGAGKSIAQFGATFTVVKTATATTVTPAVSSFPATDASGRFSDVTQYGAGTSTSAPGDLYVEGTTSSTLALVSANDTVVTGSLGASGSAALEAVSRDNVRVYHPVTCTVTTGIATTTLGFCPDDITGLYSGVAPAGARPDQQYVNLRPDLKGTAASPFRIGAAIFALGGSTPPRGARSPAERPAYAAVSSGPTTTTAVTTWAPLR